MFALTDQNHFQFGRSENNDGQFIVSCAPVSRRPQICFQESILAAQKIYDSSSRQKIRLCLSGGVDSEAMLRSFLAAKIPFEAAFLKFDDGLNGFDIKTNIEFCEAHGLRYSFVQLDILNFFESGQFYDVALKYECQSPQIATHLWFLEQVDGLPVMGGNPIAPVWRDEKWYFVGLPGELHSTYFKFFMMNDRPGVPWFFLYTPELVSSFFYLNCMEKYLQRRVRHPEEYTYLEKCRSYQEGGFDVKPRDDKYTGFERVRMIYDEKFGTEHGVGFDQKFRRPLEEIFPFPENYIQLIPRNYFPHEL